MLGGLFLLAASSAVVAVIVWSITNDRTQLADKTTGVFAMKDVPPASTETGETPALGAAEEAAAPRRRSKRGRRRGRMKPDDPVRPAEPRG